MKKKKIDGYTKQASLELYVSSMKINLHEIGKYVFYEYEIGYITMNDKI
jgi:hypothetical protein